VNTRHKKMRRTRAGQHSWTYMLLPLLALLFFSSCSVLLPGTDLKPASTPPIVAIQPIQAPYQAYRTIAIGLDISGSYPRFVFEQAKRGVADSIDGLVQPNEDGATVYTSWITENSFSPDSAAIPPIVIPALPADPAMPVLKPAPTPTGDPYQDAQAAKAVKAENARTMANYSALLKQNHAQLARVRSQVKRQTDTLARLEPPVDTISTDIYGFVERASQRLQGTQGTAFLVLATDLDNNDLSQQVQGSMHLKNVRVRVIFHYCQNAPECERNDAKWQQVFQQAGVHDIRFLDPGQSLAVPSLFS
jgi:hypothetical protein